MKHKKGEEPWIHLIEHTRPEEFVVKHRHTFFFFFFKVTRQTQQRSHLFRCGPPVSFAHRHAGNTQHVMQPDAQMCL